MTSPLAALAYSRLPSDLEGWVIWTAAALACAWVLWKSVQWTIWPGEEAHDHVKRSILDDPATVSTSPPNGPTSPQNGTPSPPNGPPTPLVSSAPPRSAAPEAHA